MRWLVAILSVTAALGGTAARADDDCFVPMANWQPREAVDRLAKENGWTLSRIRIDDGCYEVIGTDREGRAFEMKIHPETLNVIETEYESDDSDDDQPSKDD